VGKQGLPGWRCRHGGGASHGWQAEVYNEGVAIEVTRRSEAAPAGR